MFACVWLQQTKTKYEIEAEKRELARLLEKRTQEVENLTRKISGPPHTQTLRKGPVTNLETFNVKSAFHIYIKTPAFLFRHFSYFF